MVGGRDVGRLRVVLGLGAGARVLCVCWERGGVGRFKSPCLLAMPSTRQAIKKSLLKWGRQCFQEGQR